MDWVRLELTPNSLQDCRSAELSYQPVNCFCSKWRRRESNPRPAGYEPAALPLSYSASMKDEPGRTRTRTDPFRRRMLFPLSYRPAREGDGGSRTRAHPLTRRALCRLELHRRVEFGRGGPPVVGLSLHGRTRPRPRAR